MDGFQINNAELAATAVKPEQYPDDGLPEFVFAGRSNVGKSSLINVMANRKALARTSQSPGKTRTLNFYRLSMQADKADKANETNTTDTREVCFVDLPGYGYARVSRGESEQWGRMIERYLKDRRQIRSIIMLLDIRHEPSAGDRQLFEWLNHYGYNIMIIAAKADKIKRSQVQKRLSALRGALGVPDARILPFSSLTRDGREEFWKIIADEISDHE